MLHWSPSTPRRHRLFWRLWFIVLAIHLLIIILYAFFTRSTPMVVHVSRGLLGTSRPIKVLSMVRQTGQLQRVFEPTRRRSTRVNKQPMRGLGKAGNGVHGQALVSGRARAVDFPVDVPSKKSRQLIFKKRQEKLQEKTSKKAKNIGKKERLAQKNAKKELISQQKVEVKERREILPVSPGELVPSVGQLKVPVKHLPVPAAVETTNNADTQPMVVEPVVPVEAPTVAQVDADSIAEGPYELTLASGADAQDDSPVVLGQEEYELLQAYRVVYEQVSAQWRPPAGIKPLRSCIVLITVDNRGLVAQLTLEQSSGVLAYDIAARMAIARSQFPKHMWNEQIRLHF